jgi:hypothetical protein
MMKGTKHKGIRFAMEILGLPVRTAFKSDQQFDLISESHSLDIQKSWRTKTDDFIYELGPNSPSQLFHGFSVTFAMQITSIKMLFSV